MAEEQKIKRKRIEVVEEEEEELASASKAPKLKKDKEGGFWAALGGAKEFKGSKTQKRVTVSSFKGHVNVQFREYYEKDGKFLPGKSGLSLNKEQFESIIALAPEIRDALKELS
mmetsp:Transcript_32323/g.50379  ORF Transcript_32323/g.50379 Transcript_32323/m.50379 type:complete len:114 (-) Transcript_32323:42-383(-)